MKYVLIGALITPVHQRALDAALCQHFVMVTQDTELVVARSVCSELRAYNPDLYRRAIMWGAILPRKAGSK